MSEVVKITWKQTDKQKLAWQHLNDRITDQILWGGAAGGGKTHLGCSWLAISAIRYNGSRWLLGREELKAIKQSTLLTLFDVMAQFNIKRDQHYVYKEQDGIVRFANGSDIYLRELKEEPSDPMFEKLGSTEFTGAFIDEAGQITRKARDIVITRLRYKIDQFGVIPKLLMTCNPTKNWLYDEFYAPYVDGSLDRSRVFIPALVTDNPFLPKKYIENLENLSDESEIQRLRYGNWDYEDDPQQLISGDMVQQAKAKEITFDRFQFQNAKRCIGIDVAREGDDRTVILAIRGNKVVQYKVFQGKSLVETFNLAKWMSDITGIKTFAVDDTGLGGGVTDQLIAAGYDVLPVKFGAKPLKDGSRFKNLKAELFWFLRTKMKEGKLDIPDERDFDELMTIRYEIDTSDSRIAIVSKQKMKAKGYKSPDVADALAIALWGAELLQVDDEGMKSDGWSVEGFEADFQQFKEIA